MRWWHQAKRGGGGLRTPGNIAVDRGARRGHGADGVVSRAATTTVESEMGEQAEQEPQSVCTSPTTAQVKRQRGD